MDEQFHFSRWEEEFSELTITLTAAAARIENGRGGNVLNFSTFSPRQEKIRA
jgi:hypothetical protein